MAPPSDTVVHSAVIGCNFHLILLQNDIWGAKGGKVTDLTDDR